MTKDKDIVIVFILIIILYLIYTKQKDGFDNMRSSSFFNYKDLTSNSSAPWTRTVKSVDKITAVLLKIITLINNKTNKEFYLINIDNITNNKIGDNETNYLIDFFIQEKNDDYTLRLIVEFNIDDKNNVKINTLTRSNASKYDFNNNDLSTYNFNNCITDSSNFTDKINITGFNKVVIPYSLYENTNKGKTKELEFQTDFLPNIVEKDIHYKNLDTMIKKHKKNCNNNLRCWDCNSVTNRDPQFCSCSKINKFKLEKAPLLEQPMFNPSIHKNLSDEKNNSWLFSPTRIEVDHNF